MDLDDLRKRLAKDGPKPIYVLQGSEAWLIDEAERVILRAAVGDPNDSMAVTRVDLAEGKTGAREVIGACRAIGLFTTRVAVVARGAEVLDKRTTDRDELARYLDAPVGAATLVLKASKLDGRSAFLKAAKKRGEVLAFEELKPWVAARWLGDHLRTVGHRVEGGVAQLIVDLVGPSMLRLRNTVDQLSLYVGPGAPITVRDVETCLAATRSHTVFELVDAVAERRPGEALQHLQAMLGHREAPIGIVAMLTRHFRMLWQLRGLRERRMSMDDAISALKIHPFAGKKLWPQTQKFADGTLRAAYERLYETDLALKSSPLPNQVLMERLVLDLCAA